MGSRTAKGMDWLSIEHENGLVHVSMPSSPSSCWSCENGLVRRVTGVMMMGFIILC